MKEYILLEDYTDEQREISLFKDDVVEILDIDKPEKWLVRTKYKNLNQVKLYLNFFSKILTRDLFLSLKKFKQVMDKKILLSWSLTI